MANETLRTDKATPKKTPEKADLLGTFWDDALVMQKQWFNTWTRPLGVTPKFEDFREQVQVLGTEWLTHMEKTTLLTSTLLNDQAKIAREFSEKLLELAREMPEREAKELVPELTREWMDTTRHNAERLFDFGTESMKVFEEIQLRAAEQLPWLPTLKK